MPRGVPASGRRQPRPVPTSQPAAEAPPASEALDEQDGVVWPADEEVPGDGTPASDVLSEEPVDLSGRPDVELSPQEREIKRLRDQLARERGRKDAEPVVEELAQPGDDGNIIIHILEDGFTALGKVWYRGEELEFELDSKAYKDTFDRLGRTWLDLRLNEFAQAERWGKVMFRNGPWPGKSYTDGSFETLRSLTDKSAFVSPPTAEELAAAERARKRRAAPHLPVGI